MLTPLACLLGFVIWTLTLVVAIAAVRISKVLMRQERPNAFPADRPHGGEAYRRLLRAHMNCVENLPLFAATILMAQAQGVALAPWAPPVYLGARVLQSVTHVSSGRSLVIHIRFVFFATQVVCLMTMLRQVASGLAAVAN